MDQAELAAARIAMVRRHMQLEIEQDWDGVIATFAHPRYELYGGGQIFDGETAVRHYFTLSRTAFPDQANEEIAIAAGGDSVMVEFWLTGTHLGPIEGAGQVVPPTGRKFRVRMVAVFDFAPDSDLIINERPYYDQMAILRDLDLLQSS